MDNLDKSSPGRRRANITPGAESSVPEISGGVNQDMRASLDRSSPRLGVSGSRAAVPRNGRVEASVSGVRPVPRSVSGSRVAINGPAPSKPAVPSSPTVNLPNLSDAAAPVIPEVNPESIVSESSSTVAMVSSEFSASHPSEQLTADPDLSDIPVATLPVGMKIDDRYEILGVLGVGGFATVYRAHHLTIDRDVALKVMDLKKGVDPSYSERFFREAKIAAKIHHNNVVSIYDFGHVAETSQPYIAMEMLHGHDLSHELSHNGPLSPKRAFVLFRPVLEALSEGHRLGIVHKDLKPENLYLVEPGGQRELMKILDFGVARINSAEVAKLTSAGQLLGTPRYLAPEYIKTQNVSPAIDVYQMALILSEALTGIPAVTGDPFHAMMLHCSGQLQIADFLLEGRVGEVFRKAICIDPNERYENCEAFGQALDTIADCFASDVPLKGGAPQLTPDSRTSSKLTAMPMSGKMTTGNFEVGGTENISGPTYAEEPTKKSKLPVIIIILLLIIGGLFVVYKYALDRQEEIAKIANEAAADATDAEPEKMFSFEFLSKPGKVDIVRNTRKLCDTPCKLEFAESELMAEFRPLLTFRKDGYGDENREITKELFNVSNGKVTVELKKLLPKEIPFKIEYTPQNAKVTTKLGNVVCTGSPCAYILNADDVAVTLTVAAAGYHSQNIVLTANDDNKKVVRIGLKRRPVPAVHRSEPPKPRAESKPVREEKRPAPPPKKPDPPKERPQIQTFF